MTLHPVRLWLVALLASASGLAAQAPVAAPPPLPVEESETATLAPASPHWVIVNTNWGQTGARIFDGDSGKMVAQLQAAQLSNVAIDPKGRYFYVAETIWSKGNRGTRQDMLTVRDARTLKVVREIALPGRLLVGNRRHDLGISPDGRFAFVYNMDPATSVIAVDLARGRVGGTTEVPGCGLSAAIAGDRTFSLCSDGSLAQTSFGARGTGSIAQTSAFFSAENDPVYDNFPVDPAGARAMLVSYSGLVYPVQAGTKPQVGAAWSIQEAAGVPRGGTAPLVVNWLPGGRQPAAWHAASGRLYVLMHMGEYWSQKEAGTELWVLDANKHSLIARKKLEERATFVEVSQDAQPLLYLHDDGKLLVLDAMTLEQKHELKEVGNGTLIALAAAS